MWKWYIVILCTEDWYILYNRHEIVKARTVNEAGRKARKGQDHSYEFVISVFGPFDEKPQVSLGGLT
jgi:hypothetical protein